MYRILFLCTGGSGRSLIASKFAVRLAHPKAAILCASDTARTINSPAMAVMEEVGLPIPGKIDLVLQQISGEPFDVVITLCNNANEICPVFPGAPARLHWPLADPSKKTYPDSECEFAAYRQMRDEIENRVTGLFKLGFLDSVLQVRRTFGSLLDNLTDGVMAHDIERKIYFFNPAAQSITGISYQEAIGRDCHELFPGRFCGGECAFCNEGDIPKVRLNYSKTYFKPNGDCTDLEMSVVTTDTPSGDVTGALVVFRDVTEVKSLKQRLEATRGFCGMIGRHPSMIKLFETIRELTDVNIPLLLLGESGTGKELVAQALHQLSRRSNAPFVPTNCGALPEGTIESELFGHVRGAFTGAVRNKKGRFELADKGTIFLDEIGEISPALQVKLLRVMQEKSFLPVGGEKLVDVDVRIICATNRDLKSLVKQGMFREDLYYRLAVMPVILPPLRDRMSDIPLLVSHFLEKSAADTGRKVTGITPEALEAMMNYPWPGNVRELSSAVQYGMIKCHSTTIELEHLPPEIISASTPTSTAISTSAHKLTSTSVHHALEAMHGNKKRAADLLGVSRMTLYRFLANNKV